MFHVATVSARVDAAERSGLDAWIAVTAVASPSSATAATATLRQGMPMCPDPGGEVAGCITTSWPTSRSGTAPARTTSTRRERKRTMAEAPAKARKVIGGIDASGPHPVSTGSPTPAAATGT